MRLKKIVLGMISHKKAYYFHRLSDLMYQSLSSYQESGHFRYLRGRVLDDIISLPSTW